MDLPGSAAVSYWPHARALAGAFSTIGRWETAGPSWFLRKDPDQHYDVSMRFHIVKLE
jgi:hypothetical protein